MAGLLYCTGLLLVGGALAWVLLPGMAWMPLGEVKEELVKIGLQVLFLGLAGGGVKLLLDRQAEHRTFRADMLERLGRAHKEVYRVRRLLTLDGQDTPALMGELMNVRQDLGAAYHFARVWGLRRKVEEIQRETEAMRAYLEKVIVGGLDAEAAAERAAYTNFLAWRGGSGEYDTEFKARYLRAKELVDPSFGDTSAGNSA